jgi:hypothetical protein
MCPCDRLAVVALVHILLSHLTDGCLNAACLVKVSVTTLNMVIDQSEQSNLLIYLSSELA